MCADHVDNFPVTALLPKKETGVSSFLQNYPECDGRGVIIAILDTGVDPGAAGLQVTSDGKPKLLERYDCSGAGDVNTSTVVTPNNGTILGLTGRTLKIPKDWVNPKGKYHIGVKKAYELYEKDLETRVSEKRKETRWNVPHKYEIAKINKEITDLAKEQEKSSKTLDVADVYKKDELEARLSVFLEMEKQYIDKGPTYDCVVFHNGNHWCACLDTSEKGDLASCKLLGEYTVTREYTFLTADDQLNYSINVYNDGNLLEIVSNCGSHGTHVAAIAAANFPENPERNGLAPGAQLISLSIGDARLSSMETGTALVRSMIKLMDSNKDGRRVHLINMSYGEDSLTTSGYIGKLMREVVDKFGIVWVCAGGNAGPALSTVSAPLKVAEDVLIGVGAYVSAEMMEAEYSLRKKLPGVPYTWSSRGPLDNGARGISVCAPGGAITSIPTNTLANSCLMNGTSMASPNCAGTLAVLLSGLLKSNLSYTPYSIKRSIINTAAPVAEGDIFAQGFGLVQVNAAFEHLKKYHDVPESRVRFAVKSVNEDENCKGIYIRSGVQNQSKHFQVVIEPVFFNTDKIDPMEKINFKMSLKLVCDATWVECSKYLEVMNLSRNFQVKVDPCGLNPGVHNTRILAYDAKNVNKGFIFSLEITLVQPETVIKNVVYQDLKWNNVEFKPSTIKRQFVVVPDESTYCVLRLQCDNPNEEAKYMIHFAQLHPRKPISDLSLRQMVTISSEAETVIGFKVQGGLTLEVCIAKFWADSGTNHLSYSLHFGGVKPNLSSITMHHADGLYPVFLHGGLQKEEVAPEIKLKENVVILRPKDSEITPYLFSRDIIPEGRPIYQLVLTYSFTLSTAAEVYLTNGYLHEYLYDSEFESQMWMIYDCNKQLMVVGDWNPSKYTKKLKKGDYTVKHQIRHEKKDQLAQFISLPLMCSQKLEESIILDIYPTENELFLSGKKMMTTFVPPGSSILPLYINSLPNKKLLKSITPGQFLKGTITFAKDETVKKINVYPFKYVLSEFLETDPEKKSKIKKKNSTPEEICNTKINLLKKLDYSNETEKLYEEILKEYPENVEVYSAFVKTLESGDKYNYPGISDFHQNVFRILNITAHALEKIDENKLLTYFGTKVSSEPDASEIKLQMEKLRTIVIDIITRRGVAMCHVFMKQHTVSNEIHDKEDPPEAALCTLENIDKLWFKLLKFMDSNEAKGTHFALWHSAVNKYNGRLLKMLYHLVEEKSDKKAEESMIWVANQAKWDHIKNYLVQGFPSRYPHSFQII